MYVEHLHGTNLTFTTTGGLLGCGYLRGITAGLYNVLRSLPEIVWRRSHPGLLDPGARSS
jgi:hypothetical protein